MKYLVMGDTHIGIKKSSKKYHQIVLDLFDEVCEYAVSNGIKNFIQVGDLFDNRKAITHDSIECALAIADKVSQAFDTSYFIVGNHDTPSKDTMFPHSLMIFEKHPRVVVIDKPTMIDGDVLALPWMFDKDDMVDAKVCIGHFDINGAMMNTSGTLSRSHRLNFSDFSKYQLTLSGHYHTPNTYKHNVIYMGSPYQITFNDMNSIRGFHVLDTSNTDTIETIEFDGYPKHLEFTDTSESIHDIEGNIIRLTFTDDYGIDGNREIIDKFREMKPYSLRVKYARIDSGMTDEDIEESISVKTKLEILNEYHKKAELPDGINLGILDKISTSIYKGIQSE